MRANTTTINAPLTQKPSAWLFGLLVVVVALRIVGYFTLFPDSLALTQVVKIILRCTTTGGMMFFLLFLRQQLPNERFEYDRWISVALYIAYLLLGFISILWSRDVGISALQWFMIVECFVFSVIFCHILLLYDQYALQQYSTESLVLAIQKRSIPTFTFSLPYLLSRAIGLICLGFVIAQYIDPDTLYRATHGGEVHRLGGFIINPNELGMLAAVGVAAQSYELLKRNFRIVPVFFILVGIAVILLTQSRSTLGGLGLIILLYVLQSKYRFFQFATLVGGVLAVPFIITTIIFKQGDVEEVLSMTGRLPFWQDLLAYGFPEEALWGYGFMRISYTNYFDSIHAYAASMTHNTFLQVLLNLGLVGMYIVTLQMLATVRNFILSGNRDQQLFGIGMFLPIFINSITEFGIFGESNYGIMFYQLFFLMLCFKLKK